MTLMTRRRHAWHILSSLFYYYSFFVYGEKLKLQKASKWWHINGSASKEKCTKVKWKVKKIDGI